MTTTLQTINLSQARHALIPCINAGIPALWTGTPGLGKTESARQVAEKLIAAGRFAKFIEIRFSTDPPIEHRQSRVIDGKLEILFSDLIPFNEPVFIFVDEIGDLDQYESAIACQLILDKQWGGKPLFPGSYVMAAGNLPEHRASAQPMPSQLLDRFAVFNIEPDGKQWLKDYAIPKKLHSKVIGFVRQLLADDTDPLRGFNPDDPCSGATARSLTALSRMETAGIPADERTALACCQACLGVDLGNRYATYRQIGEIDVNDILRNPDTAEIPVGARFYAALAVIASHASPDTISAILQFSKRLARYDAIGLLTDAKTVCPA